MIRAHLRVSNDIVIQHVAREECGAVVDVPDGHLRRGNHAGGVETILTEGRDKHEAERVIWTVRGKHKYWQ